MSADSSLIDLITGVISDADANDSCSYREMAETVVTALSARQSVATSPIYLVSTHLHETAGNDSRTWGFYHTLADAESAVFNNLGAMEDCLYTYLVIERVEPGIIAMPEVVQWYEWAYVVDFSGRDDYWAACVPPPWAEHMTSFGIG